MTSSEPAVSNVVHHECFNLTTWRTTWSSLMSPLARAMKPLNSAKDSGEAEAMAVPTNSKDMKTVPAIKKIGRTADFVPKAKPSPAPW